MASAAAAAAQACLLFGFSTLIPTYFLKDFLTDAKGKNARTSTNKKLNTIFQSLDWLRSERAFVLFTFICYYFYAIRLHNVWIQREFRSNKASTASNSFARRFQHYFCFFTVTFSNENYCIFLLFFCVLTPNTF